MDNKDKKTLSFTVFKAQQITTRQSEAQSKLKQIVARQKLIDKGKQRDDSSDEMDF